MSSFVCQQWHFTHFNNNSNAWAMYKSNFSIEFYKRILNNSHKDSRKNQPSFFGGHNGPEENQTPKMECNLITFNKFSFNRLFSTGSLPFTINVNVV